MTYYRQVAFVSTILFESTSIILFFFLCHINLKHNVVRLFVWSLISMGLLVRLGFSLMYWAGFRLFSDHPWLPVEARYICITYSKVADAYKYHYCINIKGIYDSKANRIHVFKCVCVCFCMCVYVKKGKSSCLCNNQETLRESRPTETWERERERERKLVRKIR